MSRKPEVARADRILPGVWRLRLPLPWPGVPHVNAFAIADGDGVVLVDTGMATPDGLHQLEIAFTQAGLSLGDVRLLVCTHAHTDHYGLAGPIVEASGCELWMHPAWQHIRTAAEDPDRALERRIEVARQSGVPPAALERYRESRKGGDTGIARVIAPDRDLVPGVTVDSDLGRWEVRETPGHAPSHVVLHQPQRRLLISGDHLLGRVSLFFDYGHTPDPVGEYLGALDSVAELDVGLCLAGHGRPFREVPAKIEATRDLVISQMDRVRGSIAAGPKPAFGVIADLVGAENLNPRTTGWGLQMVLSYLDHLVASGEVAEVPDSDPKVWRSVEPG